MNQSADESGLDFQNLNREMDKTKSSVFLDKKHPSFFGSLMCSLTFIWTQDVDTAATDGVTLWWNPVWFMQLTPAARHTVLRHELWHVARLHMVRMGTRDPRTWNYACDIRINNDLERDGHSFEGIEDCWKDHNMDATGILSEEDIYDILMKNQMPPPPAGCFGVGLGGDMQEANNQKQQQSVNAVVQAVQQAKIAGQGGNIPGGVEETLNKFLEPVVHWEKQLMEYFTDMLNEEFSWQRPNRRYCDMYLPSRFTDDGRLEHLAFYMDASGSVSASMILRFLSETKYIQEVLKPQRLTLIIFDTVIQGIKEFKEEDPFDEIQITGRGGTKWEPIRAHMEENKPTAAVVFTDMGFWDSVDKPNIDVPVLWAVQGNPGAKIPFGKAIHIK